MTRYKKITIIGVGLIGGSIARKCQEINIADALWCLEASPELCALAIENTIVDKATTDVKEAIEGADLIIIATAVGSIKTILTAMAPYVKKGAIVSDTGSVKESVVKAMQEILPAHIACVPAHPIAGTENQGVLSGFATLFQNRYCLITPSKATQENHSDAVEKVKDFWVQMGAIIEVMDPKHHDRVLSMTSHIPHLVAYAIVGTAHELEEKLKKEGKDNISKHDVIRFSAGGFRDFTRIAGSNPVMWRDIFLHNKEATLEMLGRLTEDLFYLSRAIRDDDADVLEDWFSKTRDIRRSIIDQKMTHTHDIAPDGATEL